jgi:hypothetical protein
MIAEHLSSRKIKTFHTSVDAFILEYNNTKGRKYNQCEIAGYEVINNARHSNLAIAYSSF